MTSTPAFEITNLTRSFGKTTAIDDLTVSVAQNTTLGLLGRNGAEKTPLMALVTGQDLPSSGSIRVFGEKAFENAEIQSKMSFIRDNQRYPEDFTARQAFAAARIFHDGWDQQLADKLIKMFVK